MKEKAMREKAAREKEHLSQHLITTVEELKKALQDIDSEVIITSKKKQKWSVRGLKFHFHNMGSNDHLHLLSRS